MRFLPLTLLVLLVGCQKFHVDTPPQFLALDDDSGLGLYDYRATSANGVVLSVRDIDNEPFGDRAFWVRAIRERLRLSKGYALLEEQTVEAASGETGTQLDFGREEHGKQYVYSVRVFVTDEHVFIIESGGRRDRVKEQKAALDRALKGFTIRGLGTGTSTSESDA